MHWRALAKIAAYVPTLAAIVTPVVRHFRPAGTGEPAAPQPPSDNVTVQAAHQEALQDLQRQLQDHNRAALDQHGLLERLCRRQTLLFWLVIIDVIISLAALTIVLR